MDTPTKTFDPMTAPLNEVMEWLAGKDGWHKCDMGWARRVPLSEWRGATMEEVVDRPITLDRLAGMLPEGWEWSFHQHRAAHYASALHPIGDTVKASGDTELEARARVVAAVLMRGNKPEKPRGKRVFMQTQPDGTMKTIE